MADDNGARVIHVDLSRCVGHGKCYMIAPELMEPFDDEGHSRFHGKPVQDGDRTAVARAENAIDSCPERALSWRRSEDD
jgi:ferredoxin